MQKRILLLLSIFFVFLSFFPTLYEITQAKNLAPDRTLELVHNYVFDYNFYLSRIREGLPAFVPIESGLRPSDDVVAYGRRSRRGEGRWLVTEKYYNKAHTASLFQAVYLYLGKIGGIFGLTPPAIYHAARVVLGLILLLLLGKLVMSLFPGWWSLVAYLSIVTAGSWPILVKMGNLWRFSSHWGGWSVIDPLQRITFLPHVLTGQIFLVLFVWMLLHESLKLPKLLMWGVLGLIAGIIFPPVLVMIYAVLGVMTVIEVITNKSLKSLRLLKKRIIFVIFSLPALLYLQLMMKIEPWKALAVFDMQHRSILPYGEYALALGPMLPLGLAGLFLALIKKEKKFLPFVSWILALGLLFAVFERIPQQSPTRFTQMLINVPLGILATYFFCFLWQTRGRLTRPIRGVTVITVITIILLGSGVMGSQLLWKIDEVKWKRESTWLYPVGVQLVYPLKDFMDGITFLKNNTKTTDVVLAYEAAGNYIPAYAGNYVYLGHANTPDEDKKLNIAARFFKGEMKEEEAEKFLKQENIKYIYFGPQERELGRIDNLISVYSFITSIYTNNQVTIYKFSI